MINLDARRSALTWLLAIIVIANLLVSLWHGATHARVPVPLPTPTSIGIAIVALPVLGLLLLWSRWRRQAVLLIALAMFLSLIVGFIYHFAIDSPDNVLAVPVHEWRHHFVVSAALLAAIEAAGTAIAAMVTWMERSTGSGT